jgi:hypothetical protein
LVDCRVVRDMATATSDRHARLAAQSVRPSAAFPAESCGRTGRRWCARERDLVPSWRAPPFIGPAATVWPPSFRPVCGRPVSYCLRAASCCWA